MEHGEQPLLSKLASRRVPIEWYEDFGMAGELFPGTGDLLTVQLAPGAHSITSRDGACALFVALVIAVGQAVARDRSSRSPGPIS